MTKSTNSFCAKRITPIAAALALAISGSSVLAGPVADKLTTVFIPTVKTAGDLSKATSEQILTALALALQDPDYAGTTTEVIIAEALFQRKDKDKIAGQALATAVAARNLSNDPNALGDLTAAVLNVAAPKAYTAAGQASVIAAALRVGNPATSFEVGRDVAPVFDNSAAANKNLATLLSNTAKTLGKGTFAAQGQFESFVAGLFDANEVVEAERKAFVLAAVQKVAASNPAAAGAIAGGLVLDNPLNEFSTNAGLQGLAIAVINDSKSTKAIGEVLANTMGGHTDKQALAAALVADEPKDKALIAQGLFRAGTGSEVGGIFNGLGAIAPKDRAKFATTALAGTTVVINDDLQKVTGIVTNLAIGADTKQKTDIGLAAINAAGATAPAAGGAVVEGLGFSDAERQTFGTTVVGKIKALAAAGSMAAEIVSSATSQTQGTAVGISAALIAKGSKAAADIAREVSLLPTAGTPVSFTQALSAVSKKAVQSIAVGVSVAYVGQAGDITAAAITHTNGTDKSALGKTAKIAGAVAGAVDEERIADIALKVGGKMAQTATTLRPIKSSAAAATATALAKAIQTKPGVRLSNRMDELGETAAALTLGIINGFTGAVDTAKSKLIAGVGSAVLKTLSKTARITGTPHFNPITGQPTDVPGEVAFGTKFAADLWEARDIAGSIAQAIFASTLSVADKAFLLGTSSTDKTAFGPLLTAFLKLAGKKDSATYNAVLAAFDEVRAGNGADNFEDGTVIVDETDTKNG